MIGHSCCGVPANVLSVCLFVCFFLAKLIKNKILNDNIEELSFNKVILIWAELNMKVIITIFIFNFFLL